MVDKGQRPDLGVVKAAPGVAVELPVRGLQIVVEGFEGCSGFGGAHQIDKPVAIEVEDRPRALSSGRFLKPMDAEGPGIEGQVPFTVAGGKWTTYRKMAEELRMELHRALEVLSPAAVTQQLLVPLIHSIGDLWEEGGLKASHERPCTLEPSTMLRSPLTTPSGMPLR